ncbi:putative protein OS=Cellulomonas persica OX=76861 GN=CPE01_01400 PE=4 SV=1 [Cellulomonas persica]|uniref:Uncharacterized protein n=2 Tax=Cellulomonas persica TaxID=76861 RepID=A0A510UP12_9CELL|nr:hypothetical protein CPE01_01400 [Cellulomonas persica]
MRGFVARQQEYVARLDADERAVLAGIASEVGVLLGAVPFRKTARQADAAASAAPTPTGAAGGQVDEGDDEDDVPGDLLDDGPPLSALGWAWQRPVERPTDPAVRRLLPDASDDPEQAAEFRRLTDADLRERKITGLRTWWQALRTPGGPQGDAVAVTAAEAPAVAAAMTDVRLVLADRLGIRTDEDGERIYQELAQPAPAAPDGSDAAEAMAVRRAFVGVYAMLSELQETLVGAMLAQARARRTSQGGAEGGRGIAG